MTTLALEIHDAGILLADQSGTTLAASPGYALWEGGAIVAGQAAVRRAREKPRLVHHRFWQDLDTEPLGKPFPRNLSCADLAHAHLSEVWQAAPAGTSRVILAVPGSFSARQLGLLLGIARACGLPVAGLVDAATAATPVATAAAGHPGRRILHLELHLHRVVATELEMSDPPSGAHEPRATVARRRVTVDDTGGLVALQNAWARRIAELFVHATRYDPFHSATAEQALYSRLPEWLEQLQGAEVVEATLGPESGERTIELTRPDLIATADPVYDELPGLILGLKRADEPITLLLARGLADLPGLEARLAKLRGVVTVPLPSGAAATGALLTQEQILATADPDPEAALTLVTRLSFEAPPTPVVPAPEAANVVPAPEHPPRCPTHLLHDGLAYPITEHPFHLGTSLDGKPGLELDDETAGISPCHCSVARGGADVVLHAHSPQGCFVNSEPIHHQATLQVGDHLRLGTPGIEFQLIAVVA